MKLAEITAFRCRSAAIYSNSTDEPKILHLNRHWCRSANYSAFIIREDEGTQVAKMHNSSLNTSNSARNLGFIFDEHHFWPSQTKLYLSPKPVTITFINFTVSGLAVIRQLPVKLLPLSFTPSLITVILSTINSLSLNYPVSSRFRTLLLVLLVHLLSPVISLPSYALSIRSRLPNTSNTSSSHLPTNFSQQPNLHTFIPS